MNFKTIEWIDSSVRMIDQTKLPLEETYVTCRTWQEMANAIQIMIIRGAPAIGVAAAMGVALGAIQTEADDLSAFTQKLNQICDALVATRPTAVNLAWAVRRMQKIYSSFSDGSVESLRANLVLEAIAIGEEDIQLCKKIGEHGAGLFQDGEAVLTHCNAGALATAGQGTALSPIYEAVLRQGRNIRVFSDETRPFLQGARLTAWELQTNGIDVTLIPDVAAASLMRQGLIQKVIVGADRIVANGDFANKIGTYSVALAAKEHGIPFYVAAPFSTIDLSLSDGSYIPIEERNSEEVTTVFGKRIAPEGIKIRNPAFDVTPHQLVTAFITEKGILYPSFKASLEEAYS